MSIVATPTKIGRRGQIVIPRRIREAAGLRTGDFVEAQLGPRNTVILKPKVLVDRNPEVERDIAASETALRAGRLLGPFDSVPQVHQALKEYKTKMSAQRRRRKKQNGQRAVTRRADARNST
jgi:AbrB family looped-hinge helix DNA binding protein